jgi:hypothetical protein
MATTPTIHFHPGRDTDARAGVLVDLRTLLETRVLVQGSSGSGKTHALYALLELHEIWLAKLGSTPRRMLELLLEAYPDAMARTALGAMCGVAPSTGTFRNYLSRLRSPGLIEDVSSGVDGEVRAASMLFPDGLR